MSIQLPENTTVIQSERVWMESDAIAQLVKVAALPQCLKAVGMPDLHQGRGIPVGAAFAFCGEIRPALIGGDAGCGVTLIGVPRPRKRGGALLRRLTRLKLIDLLKEQTPRVLIEAIWRAGPQALSTVEGLPDSLRMLAGAMAVSPQG